MTPFFRVASAGLWLLAGTAAAGAQAAGTLGAGGTPCSQYLKAARSSDILYHQASNWLLGFVSGMNEAFQTPPAAGVTSDQILKAATEYCEANPTSTVANAAHQWYASAPREAAPKQAEAPKKDDSDWIRLNLTAPARKPLLDRR